MPNNPAPALVLRDGDKDVLEPCTRSTTIKTGLGQRARIVLPAAEGMANAHIAEAVGTTTTSVWKWRKRYTEAGVDGLGGCGPLRGGPSRSVTWTSSTPP